MNVQAFMSYIISASLSISIASGGLVVRNIRLDHLSVSLSVCPQSVLWQNGWLHPDAIWGGEWGRAWYECRPIRFWWWFL